MKFKACHVDLPLETGAYLTKYTLAQNQQAQIYKLLKSLSTMYDGHPSGVGLDTHIEACFCILHKKYQKIAGYC